MRSRRRSFAYEICRKAIEDAIVDDASSRDLWSRIGEDVQDQYVRWVTAARSQKKFGSRVEEVRQTFANAAAAERVGIPPGNFATDIGGGLLGGLLEIVYGEKYIKQRRNGRPL